MKILFVNRYAHPDPSGTARMLTDLTEDLARAGHEVSVIAGRGGSGHPAARHPRKETHRGVRIRRVASGRFDRRSIAGWVANSLLFYPAALVEMIRMPRHHVIVFMSDPPLIFGLGPLIRLLRGSSFVCWSQDVYPDVAIRLGILKRNSPSAAFLSVLSRWALRSADAVAAVGEVMAENLLRKGVPAEGLHVIHNWADGDRVRPVPPEENGFLDRNGLRGRFVVLYSGNMGLGHPFDTVLKAAERLRERENILFLFIGGGKKQPLIRERVRNLRNVRFLPFQDESILAESLSAGDLHLVTLEPGLEGVIVPSKLYGALAAGRPVLFIGPAGCEPARILREADCGRVIDADDAEGLRRAVLELRGDAEGRARMAEAARKIFEARYNRPTAAAQFERLLRKVAAGRSTGTRSKRIMDLLLSGSGLIGSLPLWALFAALIKLEDGGPVFYRQARVGKNGRCFEVLKFRTMVPDAEAATGPVQAAYGDPRITRIGRLLRATAMDELPQLWNIFIGDMSFVGPRALRPVETELRGVGAEARDGEIPNFHLRHRVSPGLTGLAQIHAPRDATRRQKLRYDLLYARSRSFGLDLKLIAQSFWITFRGRWEARGRKV